MCEASAFMKKNDQIELLMENVDLVTPGGPELWHLVSLFGEQMTVAGRLESMHLVEHRLIFTPPTRNQPQDFA